MNLKTKKNKLNVLPIHIYRLKNGEYVAYGIKDNSAVAPLFEAHGKKLGEFTFFFRREKNKIEGWIYEK